MSCYVKKKRLLFTIEKKNQPESFVKRPTFLRGLTLYSKKLELCRHITQKKKLVYFLRVKADPIGYFRSSVERDLI